MSTLRRAARTLTPELMDVEPTTFEDFRACLRDLARVNTLSLGHRPTLGYLAQVARRTGGRRLRVVDVGAGYGDTLRAVADWACRGGVEVELVGVDMNPWAARAAGEPAAAVPIEWVTADVFEYAEHAPRADVILSSLFTHHLDDAGVVRFLRWMERQARVGWFVNDLHRARLPHRVFGWAARLMRWHRFVQHDGPVSFARAFRPHEWRVLLGEAGVAPHTIDVRWHFPYRLCVAREPRA